MPEPVPAGRLLTFATVFAMVRQDGHLLWRMIVALLVKGSSVMAALMLNVWVGRTVGAAGLGLFAIGLSSVALFSIAARFGHPALAMRYGSYLFHEGLHAELGSWSRRWLVLVMLCGTVLSLFALSFESWLVSTVFEEPALNRVLAPMLVAVPLVALNQLNVGLLKLSDRPVLGTQLETGGLWLGCLLVLGGCWLAQGTFSVGLLGYAYLIAGVLAAGVGCFSLRVLYRAPSPPRSFPMPADSRQVALSFMLVQLADFAQMWLPVFLLGIHLDAADAGLFNAAVRCAMLFMFLTVAFGSIIPPRLAVMYEQRNMTALGETARRMTGYVLLASVPLVVLFLLFPAFVMGLFGEEFREGASLLMILAAGRALYSVASAAQFLLMMAGQERVLRNISLISSVLVALMCLAFIRAWGATGAAVAVSFSLALQAVSCVVFVRLRLGIWAIPFMGADRV